MKLRWTWRHAVGAVAVLLVIAAVAHSRATTRAELFSCEQYLARIGEGMAAYAKAHEGAYPERLEELVPEYLPRVPVCEAAKQPYLWERSPQRFRVACPGPHPGRPAGTPSVEGGR